MGKRERSSPITGGICCRSRARHHVTRDRIGDAPRYGGRIDCGTVIACNNNLIGECRTAARKVDIENAEGHIRNATGMCERNGERHLLVAKRGLCLIVDEQLQRRLARATVRIGRRGSDFGGRRIYKPRRVAGHRNSDVTATDRKCSGSRASGPSDRVPVQGFKNVIPKPLSILTESDRGPDFAQALFKIPVAA